MLDRSGLYRLQSALACRVRATIKSICGSKQIAVTLDPWLVEGDPLGETRRRFAEREEELNGLESNDTGGEAARGDPASMRSWLSCRCMVNVLPPTSCWLRSSD